MKVDYFFWCATISSLWNAMQIVSYMSSLDNRYLTSFQYFKMLLNLSYIQTFFSICHETAFSPRFYFTFLWTLICPQLYLKADFKRVQKGTLYSIHNFRYWWGKSFNFKKWWLWYASLCWQETFCTKSLNLTFQLGLHPSYSAII